MAKKTPQKKPPKTSETDETETEGEETEENEDSSTDEDSNRKLNAMITNRMKRETKSLTKMISDLNAKIDALAPKTKTDDEEEDSDEEVEEVAVSTKKKPAQEKSKKLASLEKRVKDAEDRAAAAEKAQIESAEKSKRQDEDSKMYAVLAKSGITDSKVAKAIILTLRQDELLVRDEDTNQIRFKTVDKYGTEDLVDPEAGLGKWFKSDGKAFLPAIQVGGSGAGGDGRQVGKANLSKAEMNKLTPREKASIEIERASMGLPPLDQDRVFSVGQSLGDSLSKAFAFLRLAKLASWGEIIQLQIYKTVHQAARFGLPDRTRRVVRV